MSRFLCQKDTVGCGTGKAFCGEDLVAASSRTACCFAWTFSGTGRGRCDMVAESSSLVRTIQAAQKTAQLSRRRCRDGSEDKPRLLA